MTQDACQFEHDTSRAVRTGEWTDALRAHVGNCADCRQTRAVASLMARTAKAFGRHAPAPDPTLILIKAELEQRALRERQAARHKLIGIGLSSLAVVTSASIAMVFTAPLLEGLDLALALSGASLLLVPLIVWYAGLRPLRRAL